MLPLLSSIQFRIMKLTVTFFLLFFCVATYAQEHPPIQLSLCVLVKTVQNSQLRYNGTEKGSITINLHTNGAYSRVDVLTPFLRFKKTHGTYTITGDQILFKANDGSSQSYTIKQVDPYLTKMKVGEDALYFIRSPDDLKN